jgi:hypothetical protein
LSGLATSARDRLRPDHGSRPALPQPAVVLIEAANKLRVQLFDGLLWHQMGGRRGVNSRPRPKIEPPSFTSDRLRWPRPCPFAQPLELTALLGQPTSSHIPPQHEQGVNSLSSHEYLILDINGLDAAQTFSKLQNPGETATFHSATATGSQFYPQLQGISRVRHCRSFLPCCSQPTFAATQIQSRAWKVAPTICLKAVFQRAGYARTGRTTRYVRSAPA